MGILDGKVAIITGSASGIGRAQATIFAREGAQVVLADVNLDGINRLARELSLNGENALAVEVNVLSQGDITNLVDNTINKFGKIDILCNTAGAFDDMAPLLETSEELWDKITNINAKGLYLVTKTVLPHMINQGKGSIINIASDAGLTGGGGGAAYTSSKHAVIGFTRQLAADYKNKGIRSNSICPGLIETPMTKELINNPEFRESITKASGRLGQPEDIAKATLFLASDDADYINGVELPVDGGLINSL
jgi:3-oxoacyl-[acyl-carrier protein] reductase